MIFRTMEFLYTSSVWELVGENGNHYSGVINWNRIGTGSRGRKFFVMIDGNFQSTTDQQDPIFHQFRYISTYGRNMANMIELWPAQVKNYWNVFTKTSFKD